MSFVPNTDANGRDAQGNRRCVSGRAFFRYSADLRIKGLDLPDGISEIEALDAVDSLAERNVQTKKMDWFLGAGAYYGYIPAVVPALAGRENSSPRTRPTSPRCPRGRSRRFSSTRAWRQNCSACRWSTPALRWRHGPRRSGADGLEGKGQPATELLPADLHPEYAQVTRPIAPHSASSSCSTGARRRLPLRREDRRNRHRLSRLLGRSISDQEGRGPGA